ncbi:MAG: serine/threonine-protein kinase, partial [Aureliella sp.]
METDSVYTMDASFAVLEICLRRLMRIAPVQSPSQILELIPSLPLAAQRLILCELIKFDLNAYVQSSDSPAHVPRATLDAETASSATPRFSVRHLEFYWPAAATILPLEQVPIDLVLEEVQLRRAAGERPQWADFRQRFPNLREPIGEWLDGEKLRPSNSRPLSTKTGEVPELPVDSIVDDFHLLKLLGQGAFARVYLSKQLSMQRLVALKVSSQSSDEPRALSQLDHANIVRVYDQREITQPTAYLLYMQYVAGGTLADCIKQVRDVKIAQRSGAQLLASIDQNLLCANQSVPEQSATRTLLSTMDWPRVVALLGIQLAQGLGYAAGKGVLHRDVKPANILLNGDGIPKLADFNVSCSGLSGRAGAAAYFGGSLAYMSPEQLRVADPTDPLTADQLDGRSDLYALGLVLWELWQGN